MWFSEVLIHLYIWDVYQPDPRTAEFLLSCAPKQPNQKTPTLKADSFNINEKDKKCLQFYFITSLHPLTDQLGHKNSLQFCVTSLESPWHSLSGRWRPKLFIQKASLVLTPLSQLLEHCDVQTILWNGKHNTIKPGHNT